MMQQLDKNWQESYVKKKRRNYKAYLKQCFLVLGADILGRQNAIFSISWAAMGKYLSNFCDCLIVELAAKYSTT